MLHIISLKMESILAILMAITTFYNNTKIMCQIVFKLYKNLYYKTFKNKFYIITHVNCHNSKLLSIEYLLS